jgi:transcriptional regulator with XRE-family HTH domain
MDSTLNDRVAEEIRVQLARKNISASELARRAGMTQRSVSRRITGEKSIDMNDLERIAKALGVAVAQLLPPGSIAQKINAPKTLRYGAVRTIHTSGVPAPRTTTSPPTGHMATKAATRSDDHRHRRTGRL